MSLKLVVTPGPADLAHAAASLARARLDAKPDLVMAVPAGRTPRPMYARLRELQERAPVDYSRMRVFCVDELCPPAPPDGYFWRQITREFLVWAGIAVEGCHPFRVDADDLEAMCRAYEAAIAEAGGLDLVMLGLGPNAHLASNEPGTPFDSVTRPVPLLAETVGYILTDEVIQGPVSARAVTLGLGTIMAAREVVVLVSGAKKREPLRHMLSSVAGPEIPASVLALHPNCTILADQDACND